jgi:hypothetical protein
MNFSTDAVAEPVLPLGIEVNFLGRDRRRQGRRQPCAGALCLLTRDDDAVPKLRLHLLEAGVADDQIGRAAPGGPSDGSSPTRRCCW